MKPSDLTPKVAEKVVETVDGKHPDVTLEPMTIQVVANGIELDYLEYRFPGQPNTLKAKRTSWRYFDSRRLQHGLTYTLMCICTKGAWRKTLQPIGVIEVSEDGGVSQSRRWNAVYRDEGQLEFLSRAFSK
jgi:hypothetical protein